ncbi:galanin receptor 2b [Chiloscyllium plagiosum]|uniref:galanin receptor 2b n=1 Tax=Chiloscyllium plagiosum TaxID=36176 RepID=UPI001CB821FC|nr:galanin receptor 2b [Chiloscyllium plagiosum]
MVEDPGCFEFLIMTFTYGIIFASICSGIVLVGVFAHTLVFYIFTKYVSFRKNRLDILLVSMAVADFIALLLDPFLIVAALQYRWPFGRFFCKILQFLVAFSGAASAYSLCAVSITRAWFIMKPHRPPAMTLSMVLLVFVWVFSLAVAIPLRINATTGTGTHNTTFCVSGLYQHKYKTILAQFVVFYLVPMLVIAYNYIRLAIFLLKSPMMSLVSSRNTRRASIMILFATGSFSACWLPSYVLELCLYLGACHGGQNWEMLFFGCTILNYFYPCVNSVIYVLVAKRYRTWCWTLSFKSHKVHPRSSTRGLEQDIFSVRRKCAPQNAPVCTSCPQLKLTGEAPDHSF